MFQYHQLLDQDQSKTFSAQRETNNAQESNHGLETLLEDTIIHRPTDGVSGDAKQVANDDQCDYK